MTRNTEFIVLNYTKFGENSIVLHTLGREYGRRSFLVRVGKKSAMAKFLPLNILEADVTENPKSALWWASNITSKTPILGIRDSIYKNSMTMFMSEVLFRAIKEGANEEGLFDWCCRSIMTLDAMDKDFSNFHIRFLLELAGAMGFSPSFEDIRPFSESHLDKIRKFIELPFDQTMILPLSGEERSGICEDIIHYLEFHTESAINVKSLDVLKELF